MVRADRRRTAWQPSQHEAERRLVLRAYLAVHPDSGNPAAPLFPAVRLATPRLTGKRADDSAPEDNSAARQLTALAALSVDEAEARLVLDWTAPMRHATFYKAVFRPAVARANRLHPMFEISRFKGHAKPTTTETVYAHLLRDDHSTAMAALCAMDTTAAESNVILLRR